MLRHLAQIAILFLVLTSFIGCINTRPLVQPSFEVAVQENKKVHDAIQQALIARKWAILAKTPNSFDAEYKRGADQGARIRVSHQGNKISIKYLSSTDLQYEENGGSPVIHKRYLGWVSNLERQIQLEVGKTL